MVKNLKFDPCLLSAPINLSQSQQRPVKCSLAYNNKGLFCASKRVCIPGKNGGNVGLVVVRGVVVVDLVVVELVVVEAVVVTGVVDTVVDLVVGIVVIGVGVVLVNSTER